MEKMGSCLLHMEPAGWNAGPSNGGTVPGSSAEQSASAPTAPIGPPQDPWWLRQGDPWVAHEDRRAGGGQDKIQVPQSTEEDDRDGMKAKGYIRKVEAWTRVTRLPKPKQALVLYNNLSGKAWRDAEELDPRARLGGWGRDLHGLGQGSLYGSGSRRWAATRRTSSRCSNVGPLRM